MVTVGVAPHSWTRVTEVRETTTDVTVKVGSFTFAQLGAGADYLALRDLTVSLSAPPGDRIVRDWSG